MKLLMKPIEMIAWFDMDGIPRPLRFKFTNDNQVFKVEQIITRSEEKLAGNKMVIFFCQSEINGVQKRFELKYELNTCKWFLAKI